MRLILVSPPISRCTQLLSGSVFCGHGGDETHKNSKRSLQPPPNYSHASGKLQQLCDSVTMLSL